MHVDMGITHKANSTASDYLLDKGEMIRDLSQKPKDKLFEKSLIASVQEHEFFHHRHSCSTSYGYLSFIISSIGLNIRMETAKLSPIPKAKDQFVEFSKIKIDDLRDPYLFNILRCQLIDLLLASIENIDIELATSIISSEELIDKYLTIYLPTNIPTDEEKRINTISPTCTDIIESIATWKQFNWLSLIWYGGRSPYSQDLEKEWLSWLSNNNPNYLKTANYICKRSNLTLKNGLFGIILDLSLNPPVFSQGITNWTEFSPRLRLDAILDVCKYLPKEFITKDYLELTTKDEYTFIVDVIESKLGWHRSKDIFNDTLANITKIIKLFDSYHNSPVEGSKKYLEKKINDKAISAYLSQFHYGLYNNIYCPGYMLFPWNHKMSSFVGGLLRPIVTQYSDRLFINSMRIHNQGNKSFIYDPVTLYFVLQDMAESIWLLETFNQNIKQTNKNYARKFYKGIPGALIEHFNYSSKVKKEVKVLLRGWKKFEKFMSYRLKKDYHTYFVATN